MLEFEQLKQDILTLPDDAQRLVNDFVAFLKQRYPTHGQESHHVIDLDQEPFVGMWCDRSDMADSSAWVKQVRQQHWHR
ncbi:hypothetical protein [Leptolyngbya sp. KIOST-1]|uniref:hypothetical protein n=1 Tax=Leptolyngbya sp. KIOST-1 TaxID=1229172 RepID=UPI000B144D01|nr:hypothetical protein [Leptolyngbya sp. KIOST-1]